MPLVLEGLLTTVNEDGTPHVSPIGPVVNPELTSIHLRPFKTSRTFANLLRTREAVFHVTDDADLLARAAVLERLSPVPPLRPAEKVNGFILVDCCRWFELRMGPMDLTLPRTEMQTEIVAHGRVRDFFGFNRARHAVVEAAILATRIGILPTGQLQRQFAALRPLVEKTGGEVETRAFEFLAEHIDERLAALGAETGDSG